MSTSSPVGGSTPLFRGCLFENLRATFEGEEVIFELFRISGSQELRNSGSQDLRISTISQRETENSATAMPTVEPDTSRISKHDVYECVRSMLDSMNKPRSLIEEIMNILYRKRRVPASYKPASVRIHIHKRIAKLVGFTDRQPFPEYFEAAIKELWHNPPNPPDQPYVGYQDQSTLESQPMLVGEGFEWVLGVLGGPEQDYVGSEDSTESLELCA